jgi:hypothetical protein
VSLLQGYSIDRAKYLEVLAISHQSRLHQSLTPSVWDKIRNNSTVRSNSPAWLQDIWFLSFKDVSPAVNGQGDFIRRGYSIQSQRERITTEIAEAFYKSKLELYTAIESLHSATASIWCDLDDHNYNGYRDKELLHVAIRQTAHVQMGSSLNWFLVEVLMPRGELLSFRSNVDLSDSTINRNLFEEPEPESDVRKDSTPLDLWVRVQNKLLDLPDLPEWVKDIFALPLEEAMKLPAFDEVCCVPGLSWIGVTRPAAHSTRMDASYIEFLQGQIRIKSTGEALTDLFKKRCQALEPHIDEEALLIEVWRGRGYFSLWLFPSAPEELYWEVF